MKITKINTKIGEFGAPVSVELNAVVECMCSSRNKETADRIAAIALKSRLMMQQGMPQHTKDNFWTTTASYYLRLRKSPSRQ